MVSICDQRPGVWTTSWEGIELIRLQSSKYHKCLRKEHKGEINARKVEALDVSWSRRKKQGLKREYARIDEGQSHDWSLFKVPQ